MAYFVCSVAQDQSFQFLVEFSLQKENLRRVGNEDHVRYWAESWCWAEYAAAAI